MLDTFLIVAGAWALLTGAGCLLLAPVRRSQRDALLPAAPLFGVVLGVVVLHDTTLLLPVRSGIWVLAAVLVGLAVLAFKRDPEWWRTDRRTLVSVAVTAACGVLPAVFALGPSLAVGDSAVVQPSDNNDAFYYVTVADWLQDQAGTDVPVVGATPDEPGVQPSYFAAHTHLAGNLRMGQELVHAAVSTALGADVELTWYPLTALWVLLLPGAGVAAARFFRLRLLTGLLLGTMTSGSALVIFQLGQQNSDSLLGTGLALVALGAVVRAVGRDPLAPRWLAGLALTALIGTYTEFTPLVAPALVVAVLVRPSRELPAALRSAVLVLAVAVAAAPLAWLRALRSLLFLGGIASDTFPSAFHDAPLGVIVGRFLGAMTADDSSAPIAVVALLAAFVTVGVVGALVLSRRRWFFLTLLAVGIGLSVYFVTVRDRPYTQQRVVQLFLPLLLLVVAVGWDRLWCAARTRGSRWAGRRSRPPRLRPRTVVAAAGLTGAALFLVANAVVDARMDLPEKAKERHVGPEFAQAARWVRAVGGDDGERVDVLVGDFFSQLWITDALRDEPEVSYASLFVSYQGTTSYWDGEPRRWLLTDRWAIRDVDPGVVVHRNARFALLDLSKGKAVVAVPGDEFAQNSVVVLRSESAPTTVRLEGATRDRAPSDPPTQRSYGEVLDVPTGATELEVDLTTSVRRRVILSDADDVFMLAGVTFD